MNQASYLYIKEAHIEYVIKAEKFEDGSSVWTELQA